jgi:hypothetical protein
VRAASTTARLARICPRSALAMSRAARGGSRWAWSRAGRRRPGGGTGSRRRGSRARLPAPDRRPGRE